MKTRHILLLISILICVSTQAQMRKNRGDVFPLDRELRKGGLLIAPGLTYTLAGSKTDNSFSIEDTTYNYQAAPKGKLGFMLHLGWFHSFENPRLIDYIDFGLSYKYFTGEEQYKGSNNSIPFSEVYYESQNTFKDHNLGVFFNATNTYNYTPNAFISNSLGVNFDYTFIKNRDRSTAYPIYQETFQNPSTAQLHYKIGFGFRVAKKLLVVPSIETPILSVYKFDNGKSTLQYFSSRYRPILFTLQFYFLRDKGVDCNAPTYNGVDYTM